MKGFQKICVLLVVLLFATAVGSEVSKKQKEKQPKSALKLIVIDPGHGGSQTGARGPKGLLEKDITLKLSLKLKEILEKELKAEIILTREGDYHVPLRDRPAVANALAADIFVSVHANAGFGGARGFETFFLSPKASDDFSRELARIENAALEDEELADVESSELSLILSDMLKTEDMKESEQLAIFIQDRLADILSSRNRGVKQAPFHVLVGAACPSVLVEVGFISSRSESEKLANDKHQDKLAKAIAEGIKDFGKMMTKKVAEKTK